MKKIPLTQGKVALVDDQDFDWLNQWNWCAHQSHPGKWYAVRRAQLEEENPGSLVRMHRVLAAKLGLPHVDHWDGNGLHNWRTNLRPCTSSQNQANKKAHKNNSSGYKGISLDRGKWRAYITVNRKHKSLGGFTTPEKAAVAYDTAAREYFGEFSKTNFPYGTSKTQNS